MVSWDGGGFTNDMRPWLAWSGRQREARRVPLLLVAVIDVESQQVLRRAEHLHLHRRAGPHRWCGPHKRGEKVVRPELVVRNTLSASIETIERLFSDISSPRPYLEGDDCR